MLALPSWSFGEVELPEPEMEFKEGTQSEKGELKTAERAFSFCDKEQSETRPLNQQFDRLFESKQTPLPRTLSKRSFFPFLKQNELPHSEKKVEKLFVRLVPRHLPKTEATKPLPKPFQPLPKNTTQTKSPLLMNRGVEKRTNREERNGQQKRGDSLQAQPQVECHVRDCLDENEERKRSWSYESEDDLNGVASVQPLPVATQRLHSYKDLTPSTERPFLIRPKMGIYALYYILTKIGLISDSRSHFDTKQQVRINQEETELTHKERLIEMKKAIDEEKSSKRWAVATQVFSWFTSFMGIMTGLALIMTGVGAVAGALLLCAGLIMVTNQLMQLTGAWSKIIEKLPGTAEQKRSTLMWIQIGITVLCFLLSGAGIVFGGFTQVKQAMEASQAVMGGVIMMGYGTTSFGEGVSNYRHRRRLAQISEHQKKLAQLKHRREDLQEIAEASLTRLEQLFEELAKILEFETELFKADQKVIR